MRPLSASELLDVWERGLTQPPVQKALTLLAAACPEASPDSLAKLSIGQRDSRLLSLREWTFGSQLTGLATCPNCQEQLELSFTVADIRAEPEAAAAETESLSVGNFTVSFRLPDSTDLVTLADDQDPAATRQQLLERCLLTVRRGSRKQNLDRIPAEVITAVVNRMAEVDPQADIRLDLTCPGCGYHWQAAFDILSYFWSEINSWAFHLLREVHLLALKYSWSEADILALSPWRRRFYIEMLNGS
jgi:hypothetical protein